MIKRIVSIYVLRAQQSRHTVARRVTVMLKYLLCNIFTSNFARRYLCRDGGNDEHSTEVQSLKYIIDHCSLRYFLEWYGMFALIFAAVEVSRVYC